MGSWKWHQWWSWKSRLRVSITILESCKLRNWVKYLQHHIDYNVEVAQLYMLSFFPFRFSKLFPEFSAQYHIPEIWSYIAFRVHPLEWFCATGFSVERNTLWTRVLHNRHLKETIPYLLTQYVCRSFRGIATILQGLKWIMHLVLFIWRRFVNIPTRL